MIAPITDLYPFFEFDCFSDEIMDGYGFEVTNLKMVSENHGDRIIITVDWNIPAQGPAEDRYSKPLTPTGDFPNVRNCKYNGHLYSGGSELAVQFFFPELDAEDKEYFGYGDIERLYNGFGKIGFDVGLGIRGFSEVWKSSYPELGYDYSHCNITKYGVVVYFDKKRPNDPKPEEVLYHYEDGEIKVGIEN